MTMNPQIDYYFTSISPFTYLGHAAFLALADHARAKVRFKPVKLAEVFAVSGVKPIPERPLCRQQYRLLEIERWARKRGLPIHLKPTHFPTSPALADCCVIALQEQHGDAGQLLGRLLRGCWADQLDIADEAVLRGLLKELKIDADQLLSAATSETIQQIYAGNTREAIEQGVLGAPSYVFNAEQFWGQDRLELLSDRLEESKP